jgi:hypothetical protein
MLLYALTIFLSAFLLFQVQPIITKMILTCFGGVASAWITAMFFFQMVLLSGYLYLTVLFTMSTPMKEVRAEGSAPLGEL